MQDITRKMIRSAIGADGTITKSQEAVVLAYLEGRKPAADPVPKVISQDEASEVFGVTKKQLRVWAREGYLVPVRLGKKQTKAIGYTEASVRAVAEGRAEKADAKKSNARMKK